MLSVYQEEVIDEPEQEGNGKFSVRFEEILDEYAYERPKQGQILEGEIEAIDDDTIILDVGLKRAAIVPGREVNSLSDDDLKSLSVGDVLPVQVACTPIGDQDLIVSIDNAREVKSWEKAKKCLAENELLELEVISKNKGGLLASFDKLEGFIPNSHIPTLRNVHAHDKVSQHKYELLGSQMKVKVIEVDSKKERLILSAVEARKSERAERLKNLGVGDVITGKVVNLVHFGAFVDLGGIDGLVHISELDWEMVRNPSKVVKAGDEIDVQIIGIDLDSERVQLSRKALMPNPWDEIEAKYVPGSLVEVEITNVVNFGAFAKLPEGLKGLIHITELGYTAPGSDEDYIELGNKVLAKILRIDTERERISLSMRKVPMEKQLDWMLKDFEEEKGTEE